MSGDRKRVVGIIFPILPKFVSRIFDSGKTVFVKSVARPPALLTPRLKLFLYQSRGGKSVVGEARIREILEGTPDEILKKFRAELFLTPQSIANTSGIGSSSTFLF